MIPIAVQDQIRKRFESLAVSRPKLDLTEPVDAPPLETITIAENEVLEVLEVLEKAAPPQEPA